MRNYLKKILKKLGPGFITGAADDDPSGIGTYSQTGAMFGYKQLWISPIAFSFMLATQEMCGRIGMVTGKGLSTILKTYYPKWILYTSITLLVIANTVNISADLGAMADSAKMVFGLSFTFWIILISVLIILLEVFLSYRSYSKVLKILGISLVAYFFTAIIVGQDWAAVFKSVAIPNIRFDKDTLLNIVAFLGTSISPYLFYWQEIEEVEEEIIEEKIHEGDGKEPEVTKEDIKNMRVDTTIGMFISQLTAFMIVLTTASTLNFNGITNIETAPQAALALRPFAGDFAYLLFAIGIIGTGLLGVPVLAGSSAYAIAEAEGWKEGLGKKFNEAPYFYITIALSTFIGLIINFAGINPMKALYYAAAINGIMAPPLMLMILLIGRNKKIMGEHVSGKWSTFFGVLGILVMGSASILLLGNL